MSNRDHYTLKPHAQVPDEALADVIRGAVTGIELEFSDTKTDLDVRVAANDLTALVQVLAEAPALSFDFLRNMVALDMGEEGLAAKYQLYSFEHGHTLQVTVLTPPGELTIPSLTSFFATADWHEREAAEMIGLVFEGHPNLTNLLLEEDLKIHPLLKSHPLQPAEIVQGIEDGSPGFDF
jgi:NADH-quinone oxidoreductase subunit C